LSYWETRTGAQDEAKAALDRDLPTTESAAMSVETLTTITKINDSTLYRALKGHPGVKTIGKGKKGDPLRYFLPEVVSLQTSNPEGTHEKNQGLRVN